MMLKTICHKKRRKSPKGVRAIISQLIYLLNMDPEEVDEIPP